MSMAGVFAVHLGAASPLGRFTAGDADPQTPGFRVAVDLIPVDVQVVDSNGAPVAGLTADKFEVTINGRRRRIVSVDFIDARAVRDAALADRASSSSVPVSSAGASVPPRIFLLAIDVSSFDESVGRPLLRSAADFVRGLAPTDEVGLFSFPYGPVLDPTTDHDAVLRSLEKVMLRKDVPSGSQFSLSTGDVIDLASPRGARGQMLRDRFCGAPPDADGSCLTMLAVEVESMLDFYEGKMQLTLANLQALVAELGRVRERKVVVLVSGGVVTADTIGDRPAAHLLGTDLGRAAAKANVSLYSIFADHGQSQVMSAESRTPSTFDFQRERTIASAWLDEFSGSAGGSLLRVVSGDGKPAFARVLSETSAYYLLGVEPLAEDRDGRPRDLRVAVSGRNFNVRGRSWVVAPKPGEAPPPSIADGRAAVSAAGTATSALPPAPAPVQALATAYDQDDAAAIRKALAPRDADTLIQAFRASRSPWPDSPRRTAAFALDVALVGMRAESPFTTEAAGKLLTEYMLRIRQQPEGDAFECAWLWTAVAGLQGMFNPASATLVADRAVDRCPKDANIRLAAAVVRDQQLVITRTGVGLRRTGAGAADDFERRVLEMYDAAAQAPTTHFEARVRGAFVHYRAGRYEEGLALIEQRGAVPAEPQLAYLGDLIRGQLLRAVGRHDEGVQALRSALARWPSAQTARIALMAALATEGEAEAVQLAEGVLTADSGDIDPWWLYYLGDFRAYDFIRAQLRELAK